MCHRYEIKLMFDKNIEFINRCWSCGDEIGIGIYDDFELEFISFFHEISHVLFHDDVPTWVDYYDNGEFNSMCLYEVCYSFFAIEYAASFGIFFSQKAIGRMFAQATTYCGNERRNPQKTE